MVYLFFKLMKEIFKMQYLIRKKNNIDIEISKFEDDKTWSFEAIGSDSFSELSPLIHAISDKIDIATIEKYILFCKI